MAEILLSFFAVIGLLFFIVYLCDYMFYRNFHQNTKLTIDTRKMSVNACIDTFELVNTVRQTTSGKAILSDLLVIVSDSNEEKARIAREYMRIFHIPGEIQIHNDNT